MSVYSRTSKCDNCDHATIVRHLHSMGKVKKLGVCVPHALSQNNKNQWVAICGSLLARHRLAREQHWPFLSCIVTGDDKWCLYSNIRKRKEWLSPTREEYVENVPISPLGTLFSSIHSSTHYLQMTKLQYVNSSTTIELQRKNDNRQMCKPIATGIPTHETKSVWNYAPT